MDNSEIPIHTNKWQPQRPKIFWKNEKRNHLKPQFSQMIPFRQKTKCQRFPRTALSGTGNNICSGFPIGHNWLGILFQIWAGLGWHDVSGATQDDRSWEVEERRIPAEPARQEQSGGAWYSARVHHQHQWHVGPLNFCSSRKKRTGSKLMTAQVLFKHFCDLMGLSQCPQNRNLWYTLQWSFLLFLLFCSQNKFEDIFFILQRKVFYFPHV